MNRIASFCVDHTKLEKGLYVSRIDGDVKTYDIRMRRPNTPPYLENAALHTLEHLFATFARNSEWKDHVIYFGPMGCRTGCYFLLKDMEEAFGKAHPEYKVTWKNSVVAEGDAAKTVKTDPTAAADVYMFANDQLGDLLDQNAIAPVNDVVAQQVKEQNSQTMVDSVTGTDGKIYGVPYTSNTYFMYYNKDKFSADDVKSLDTMLEKGKVAYPLSNSWYIPAFYLGAGMTMFGPKGTDAKAGIDFGPNADAVSEALVKLVANPNFTNDDGTLGLAGLKNGTLDAYFSGSWDAANVQKALGDKYGAATVPTFKAGDKDYQMKALAGSKAIGMNPNTKAPEVASAFAAFLGSTEAQKKHWEMRQIIPSDKTLTNLEGMSTSPYVQAQLDTIAKTSVAQPTISAMSAWWTPAETFGKALVKRWLERIIVWEDHFTVELKSGLNMDIEG